MKIVLSFIILIGVYILLACIIPMTIGLIVAGVRSLIKKDAKPFKRVLRIWLISLVLIGSFFIINRIFKTNEDTLTSNIAERVSQEQDGIFTGELEQVVFAPNDIIDRYGGLYEYHPAIMGTGYRSKQDIEQIIIRRGVQEWYVSRKIQSKRSSFYILTNVVTFTDTLNAARYFDYKTNINKISDLENDKIFALEDIGEVNSYTFAPFGQDSYDWKIEVLESNAVFSFFIRFPENVTPIDVKNLFNIWQMKVDKYKVDKVFNFDDQNK